MPAPIPPVLFVTRKWAPAVGGMETWSHRIAEELARLGEVRVVALPGRADGRPPAPWRLLLFPFAVIYARLAMRPRPAALHLGDMALWPLALLAGRSRVVISAHGTDVGYQRRGGLRGRFYGCYLKLGARLLPGARIVANSSATAAVAVETGWRAAAVIPLGTDLAAEPAAAHDGTILFAGRLVARKGCGWFVREVLPILPEDAHLRIAGPEWDAGEDWVRTAPRVEFLGPLPPAELASAFAQAMCVVVPNIEPANGEFEGFGLVACEAAACGGVVLAARTGGLVDAVRDGETGMLLPIGDATAWAACIETVRCWSNQERATFVNRARETARQHFAWDRVARDTAALYGLQA